MNAILGTTDQLRTNCEKRKRKWDARDLTQPRLRIDTAHAPTSVAIAADRVAWGRGEWNWLSRPGVRGQWGGMRKVTCASRVTSGLTSAFWLRTFAAMDFNGICELTLLPNSSLPPPHSRHLRPPISVNEAWHSWSFFWWASLIRPRPRYRHRQTPFCFL